MVESKNVDHNARPLRDLFETNHAVMLLIDPKTGAIVDANPAACRFYGWTREELQARTAIDLNTLSPAEVIAAMQKARTSEHAYFKFCHRKADGSVADVEVYSGPAQVDGRSLLLSIVHDITKRVAAEKELLESDRRLRRAEEVAGLGHWMLALGEEEMHASEGARIVYGTGLDYNSVDYAQSLVLPEYRPLLDAALEALVADGTPYDVEFKVRRPSDGMIVDIHSVAEFDPETRSVFGTIQDVTATKNMEYQLIEHQDHLEELVEERTRELEQLNAELIAANQAKSDFLANVSHELRTPLNSVIGFSGTMLQGLAGPLTEEQQTQLTMILNAGKHLLELVGELLDLAHVESGHMSIDIGPFDVQHAVEHVVKAFGQLADERGLTIEVEFDMHSTCREFCSDRTRVEQVLVNLIGNALKFTPEGTIRVVTTCHDGRAEFRVIDTGIGIAPDEIESVFEEYYQARPEVVAKSLGVGLGLPLSRRLAELLGGTINVTSEPGVGSEFVFSLPSQEC